MPKFTLVCDHSCDLDTHVVTHTFTAEHIDDVVSQFEFFLKGAGYYPQGELGFIDEVQHSHFYFDTGRNK